MIFIMLLIVLWTRLYADDICLFLHGKTERELQTLLNTDL